MYKLKYYPVLLPCLVFSLVKLSASRGLIGLPVFSGQKKRLNVSGYFSIFIHKSHMYSESIEVSDTYREYPMKGFSNPVYLGLYLGYTFGKNFAGASNRDN